MLKLNSENLSQASIDYLTTLQNDVDGKATFKEKVERAVSLWSSKSSTKFGNIKDKLKKMCVGIEICVYCENNEATDIEHIYPKKLYPEKAFNWENYLLACNKCNSHHKSDKFKIFNPQNSATVEDVALARGTYKKPANNDALFLSQRNDNPMDFLEIDFVNRTFFFDEKFPIGTREFERAKFTKDLLGLNSRASLVRARKNAANFFVERLEKYVNAKKAEDFEELEIAVDDFRNIDKTADFQTEKSQILEAIKIDVLENPQPTVWKELLRQRANLPKTNRLLNDAPEAITW